MQLLKCDLIYFTQIIFNKKVLIAIDKNNVHIFSRTTK
jgi:hypothetical protein